MSEEKSPSPADENGEPLISLVPRRTAPPIETVENDKGVEPVAPAEPVAPLESETDAPEADASETDASEAETPIDAAQILADSTPLSFDVPKRRKKSWMGIVFIKLFKLSTKFLPLGMAAAGGLYSYVHFFGAPPVVDIVHQRISVAAEKLGFDVPPPVPKEKKKSKMAQMLEQTNQVVAASDSRVNLANALASGDFDTAADIEDGAEDETDSAGNPVDPGSASGPQSGQNSPAGPSLEEQLAALPEPVQTTTYSADPNSAWRKFAKEAEIEAAAEAEAKIGGETPEPETPVATRPIETIYQSDVTPSPQFQAWLQTLKIGGVMGGAEPKAFINNMTFKPGEMVDYTYRITFEGLAEGGTLLVFKDANDAFLTLPH